MVAISRYLALFRISLHFEKCPETPRKPSNCSVQNQCLKQAIVGDEGERKVVPPSYGLRPFKFYDWYEPASVKVIIFCMNVSLSFYSKFPRHRPLQEHDSVVN